MKGEMTGRLEVLVLLTRYGVRILTDNRRLPLPVFVFVVIKQPSQPTQRRRKVARDNCHIK
jgi:hypothetical protein